MINFETFRKAVLVITQILTIVVIVVTFVQNAFLLSIILVVIACVFGYFIIDYYYLGGRYPFYATYEKQSLEIRDPSGKSVHFIKDQIIRANYPYLHTMSGKVFTDGTITNFTGSISDSSISSHIEAFESEEKSIVVEQRFSKFLKPRVKYRRILEFDFIDSYTKTKEYHVFHIEPFAKIFSFRIIFPPDRLPTEPKCFHTRGTTLPLGEVAPQGVCPLPDGRKEYSWQIKHPRIGDTYKVTWNW